MMAANDTTDDARDAVAALVARGALHGSSFVDEGSRPIAWSVEGIVPERGLTLIVGAEKSGKSALAHSLVLAKLTGGTWLGRNVAPATAPALLISPDLPARDVARRIARMAPTFGTTLAAVADRLVVIDWPIAIVPTSERERLSAHAWNQATRDAIRSYDANHRGRVMKGRDDIARQAVAGVAPALDDLEAIERGTWSIIVVDVMPDCLPAGMTENDARAATLLAQGCRDLAEHTGADVVALHHSSRHGGADARAGRGSTAFPAKFDTILTITNSADGSRLVSTTMRHAKPPPPIRIELRGDEEGITSVEATQLDASTVVSTRTGKRVAGGVTADEVAKVLAAAPDEAMTLSRVRLRVAEARGGAKGAKAHERTTKEAVEALLADGRACRAKVEGLDVPAYRWGNDPRPDRRRRDDRGDVFDAEPDEV